MLGAPSMPILGVRSLLIVDDHTVVREGLKHIVDEGQGLTSFAEAATAAEALELVEHRQFDAAVVDLSLDGRSGLELVRQLKRLHPQIPILVLSMYAEEQYARRALRAGAAGDLTKGSPRAEVVQALQKVAAGGRYVSAALAERLALDLERDGDRPPHEILSDREFEILGLIAAGNPVGQIAKLLTLSDKTVSTYRARILAKLRMRSNAELMRYALENRLVE
jgi:two-component system invasion response regulator UvrY